MSVLILSDVRPFDPTALAWKLGGTEIEGPTPPGRAAVRGRIDGGGFWVCSQTLWAMKPEHHRILRALAMRVRGGRVVDVPFREQAPLGGLVQVGFSNGSTFEGGGLFEAGEVAAVLEVPATWRTDEIRVRMLSDHTPEPGQLFSLFRDFNLGSELHGIEEVADLGGGVFDLRIAPGLRQPWAAGAELDFNRPRQAMFCTDPDALWPEVNDRSWKATPALKLEETPS